MSANQIVASPAGGGDQGESKTLVQLMTGYETVAHPSERNKYRLEMYDRVVLKDEHLPHEMNHVELLLMLGRKACVTRTHKPQLSTHCVDRVITELKKGCLFTLDAAYEIWKWEDQARKKVSEGPPQDLLIVAYRSNWKSMHEAAIRWAGHLALR